MWFNQSEICRLFYLSSLIYLSLLILAPNLPPFIPGRQRFFWICILWIFWWKLPLIPYLIFFKLLVVWELWVLVLVVLSSNIGLPLLLLTASTSACTLLPTTLPHYPTFLLIINLFSIIESISVFLTHKFLKIRIFILYLWLSILLLVFEIVSERCLIKAFRVFGLLLLSLKVWGHLILILLTLF